MLYYKCCRELLKPEIAFQDLQKKRNEELRSHCHWRKQSLKTWSVNLHCQSCLSQGQIRCGSFGWSACTWCGFLTFNVPMWLCMNIEPPLADPHKSWNRDWWDCCCRTVGFENPHAAFSDLWLLPLVTPSWEDLSLPFVISPTPVKTISAHRRVT